MEAYIVCDVFQDKDIFKLDIIVRRHGIGGCRKFRAARRRTGGVPA